MSLIDNIPNELIVVEMFKYLSTKEKLELTTINKLWLDAIHKSITKIYSNSCTNRDLLYKLTNLKDLHLEKILDDTSDILCNLPRLTIFSMAGDYSFTPDSLLYLSNLKMIHLRDNSTVEFNTLCNLTNLEYMTVKNNYTK